ncbi:outer membrane beta-barrel protein, partial [Helicobacter pylori]
MKKFFSQSLLALIVSMNMLLAMDGNGVFLGAGYLQGQAQMHADINSQKQATNATIKGFDALLGYQFFFEKHFGLRLYGFFDYAHANSIRLKNPNYNSEAAQVASQILGKQEINRLTNIADPKTFEPNMLTYGGAMDV